MKSYPPPRYFARCLGCGTAQSWEPDNYIAITRNKETADIISGKFKMDHAEDK